LADTVEDCAHLVVRTGGISLIDTLAE
jgi:hypothetical protein